MPSIIAPSPFTVKALPTVARILVQGGRACAIMPRGKKDIISYVINNVTSLTLISSVPHITQFVAIKCRKSNISNASRQEYGSYTIASPERTAANTGHTVWNSHFSETGTAVKSHIPNPGHTVRNI